jgi:hypothetical protein
MHRHRSRDKNLWMDLIQVNAVNLKGGEVTRTRQRGRRRKGHSEHAMVVLVILQSSSRYSLGSNFELRRVWFGHPRESSKHYVKVSLTTAPTWYLLQ